MKKNKVISASEGSTKVLVSAKELNVIEVPDDIIALAIFKTLKVKETGDNVIGNHVIKVRFAGSHPKPGELYIVTDRKTISLLLFPKNMPAKRILVRGGCDLSAHAKTQILEKGVKEWLFGKERSARQ